MDFIDLEQKYSKFIKSDLENRKNITLSKTSREQQTKENNKQKTRKWEYIILKNGAKYNGECINGKKDGYGEYTWKDGAVYKGMKHSLFR